VVNRRHLFHLFFAAVAGLFVGKGCQARTRPQVVPVALPNFPVHTADPLQKFADGIDREGLKRFYEMPERLAVRYTKEWEITDTWTADERAAAKARLGVVKAIS